MITIERMIQEVFPDKWTELEEIEKKYVTVEERLGFPPKRRSYYYSGGHKMGTLVIEREWESLATMEATYEKANADSEMQALNQEVGSIIKSNSYELLGLIT